MSGLKDSPYTDPDFQIALYNDPENSVLLADYALATGAVQLGAASANLGASNAAEPPPTGEPSDTWTGESGDGGPPHDGRRPSVL